MNELADEIVNYMRTSQVPWIKWEDAAREVVRLLTTEAAHAAVKEIARRTPDALEVHTRQRLVDAEDQRDDNFRALKMEMARHIRTHQRLVDTTTALERADDFLQAWFEWQPEDDPSPRFGAVVQAGARLRAALAAVAPAPHVSICSMHKVPDPNCEQCNSRPVAPAPPTEPTDGD